MEAGLATESRGISVAWARSSAVLILGLLAITIPVMIHVAQESWSTEQGGHGPIVLATGLWLLSREWSAARAVARPGSWPLGIAALALLLPLYIFASVTSTVEIEGASLYATVLTVAYMLWGMAALRKAWFPLFYLMFMFPPPDTLFAMLTQPLKIAISQWAVAILHAAGYPVAASGAQLQIGQYEMLVAAACAGLSSMISLMALGLFYIYLRHSANWRYMLLLALCIVPVSIVANLIRVLILLLLTYHFGEAAGQGFLHDAAGLTMFMTALLGILLIDRLARPIRDRLAGQEAAR
ncbi:MAG: exosortase V [Sphingomonas bacterium]